MRSIRLTRIIRKLSTIHLVVLTFLSFVMILIFLASKYTSYIQELESIIVEAESQSQKMQINSELMELARSRTRLTSQILNSEDPFEKDELNIQLESFAGRFVRLRQQLFRLELNSEERNILESHNAIVPVILPAQREAVELALTGDDEAIKKAEQILYEVVFPGQGEMIESFGKMIAIEQRKISESTHLASQLAAKMRQNSNTLVSIVLLIVVFVSVVVIGRIQRIQNKLMSSYDDLEQKVEKRTNELRLARDDLQSYIDIIDKYVITSHTDSKGIITYTSEAFCRISQYSESELLGRPHNVVRHPDMPKSLYNDLWSTIKQGKIWRGEIKNRAKNGDAYWVDVNIEPKLDSNGNITGYAAIRQDITHKKRIEEISVTDRLTQLYNRLKLDETLSYEVERSDRYGNHLSIILFDIDHFKGVNDSYGHPQGDAVLITVADIAKKALRHTDIIGRWGGEEFMVICPDTNLDGAIKIADKVRHEISSFNFSVVGHLTSSFGVAEYRADEGDSNLLKRVDTVLYKAKDGGRNRVEAADADNETG